MDYYHNCLHTHVNATAPPTLNCCTHAHPLLDRFELSHQGHGRKELGPKWDGCTEKCASKIYLVLEIALLLLNILE